MVWSALSAQSAPQSVNPLPAVRSVVFGCYSVAAKSNGTADSEWREMRKGKGQQRGEDLVMSTGSLRMSPPLSLNMGRVPNRGLALISSATVVSLSLAPGERLSRNW